MTQDHYDQARGAGYGARGEVVEDENDEYADDPGKPMTRFQKVASALRGDRPDEPGEDQVPADQAGVNSPAAAGPGGAAGPGAGATPNVPVTEVRTDPRADPDEAAGQTRPDIPNADLPAAQDPAAAPGNGSTAAGNGSAAYQDQAGAATISDVPVAQTAEDAPVSEASGRTGRHAGVPAQEMRPGDATGTLDDLGDLAYGKLVPDAADFTAQWQQIQFRFVDDPRASVTEAAEVVSQVTAKLEAAIQERQRAIAERQQAIQERQRTLQDRWGEGSQADTETLRETLRMYRAFLDQLIGPKV